MVFGESFEASLGRLCFYMSCKNPVTLNSDLVPRVSVSGTRARTGVAKRRTLHALPMHGDVQAQAESWCRPCPLQVPPNTTKHGQSSYAWQPVVDKSLGSRATISLDTTTPFSGQASQKIQIVSGSGSGSAGLANRGLGNEGFYLKAGMEYEGYFFAASSAAVTLEVGPQGA